MDDVAFRIRYPAFSNFWLYTSVFYSLDFVFLFAEHADWLPATLFAVIAVVTFMAARRVPATDSRLRFSAYLLPFLAYGILWTLLSHSLWGHLFGVAALALFAYLISTIGDGEINLTRDRISIQAASWRRTFALSDVDLARRNRPLLAIWPIRRWTLEHFPTVELRLRRSVPRMFYNSRWSRTLRLFVAPEDADAFIEAFNARLDKP